MAKDNLLKKQLIVATLEDFVEVLKPLLGLDENPSSNKTEAGKKYVYGVAGLAKLLGCSIATAQRRISSGALDECIIRNGRLIIIESDAALTILKGGQV